MAKISEPRSAFTLIELLASAGVIVILAVAVVTIVNPPELLRQSRDNKRIAELTALAKTVDLHKSLSDRAPLGSALVSYVSVPDPAATSSLGNQCQSLGLPPLPTGWTYHCAGPAFYRKIDGTGWLPVDLGALPSGAPFTKLAADPLNSTSTGHYYTYVTNGALGYELTAAVESQKYGKDGPNDVVSRDGGQYADLFEAGFDVALAPLDHSNGGGDGPDGSMYSFGSGFLPPIESGGAGIYKLGRTLPVKFRLTDPSGAYSTVPTARLFVTKVQDGIVGNTPVTLASGENDGGGLFNAQGNQYLYNLDTGLLDAGTWQLKAVLNDGASYAELISLEP